MSPTAWALQRSTALYPSPPRSPRARSYPEDHPTSPARWAGVPASTRVVTRVPQPQKMCQRFSKERIYQQQQHVPVLSKTLVKTQRASSVGTTLLLVGRTGPLSFGGTEEPVADVPPPCRGLDWMTRKGPFPPNQSLILWRVLTDI